jgi:hypothetical protein
MHGLIFETSVYYWQDQPGNYVSEADEALLTDPDGRLSASPQPFEMKRSEIFALSHRSELEKLKKNQIAAQSGPKSPSASTTVSLAFVFFFLSLRRYGAP